MKKYMYRLMTKGFRKLSDTKTWNVAHYSKPKYVMAKNEDLARGMIREKLSRKWLGFRMMTLDEVK